jgi:hypothetical protein
MLFLKNKETAQVTEEKAPRPPRYDCVVRVGLNGFEGEAVLKNISAGGFLMESRTYAAITVGDHYTMQIKPDAASGLKLFELEVEVRWIQSAETRFSAGFLVMRHPADKSFDTYLEYVKTKSHR